MTSSPRAPRPARAVACSAPAPAWPAAVRILLVGTLAIASWAMVIGTASLIR